MFYKIKQKNVQTVIHFTGTGFYRNLISSIKKKKKLVQETLVTIKY